jgi:hypothetical protein
MSYVGLACDLAACHAFYEGGQGDKVHLRQEILACRPPGGDPPAQKTGLRLGKGTPSRAQNASPLVPYD